MGLTKRALVIGGGIAGIQAALDIANAGYEVVLVERTGTIGGKMAMLDKTFPTLDCSACILTPLMVDVAQHSRIKLMTYAEVKSVKGFVGNFDVEIVQKARMVNHEHLHRLRHLLAEVPGARRSPPSSTRAWACAPRSTSPSPRRCPTSR